MEYENQTGARNGRCGGCHPGRPDRAGHHHRPRRSGPDDRGIAPGRLVIVAGRPGMGKGIVGANIACATAAADDGCLPFSLEMPAEEIGARILSGHAFRHGTPVTSKAVFEGHLGVREIREMEAAASELAGLPLLIETPAMVSVGEVFARRASGRHRGQRV